MPPPRRVEPEILDSLDPDHPDALASRRDLRLINSVMGNFRWIARELQPHVESGGRVVEPGAGDGGLGRLLWLRFPGLAGRYVALDLSPRPAGWPAELGWVQGDLFSAPGAALLATADVIVANLFFHHFDAGALARIGEMLGKARVLILSEPARREIHVRQGRLLGALGGFNRVTRHDLAASVRGGFRGGELAELLRLDGGAWQWRTSTTWVGAHRTVASRTGR